MKPNEFSGGSLVVSVDSVRNENAAICGCKQINDTTIISLGVDQYHSPIIINIRIHQGLFDISLQESSRYDSTMIHLVDNQNLVINKDSINISDRISGSFLYQGKKESKEYPIQLIKVTGHFNCSVKDSSYNYQNLKQDLKKEELEKKLRSNPDSITHLYLKDLDINEIPTDIKKFENLRILDLSNNNLKSPDFSLLSSMTNLYQLDLSRNNVSQIDKEIGTLKALTNLDLSYNEIQFLPLSVFQLENLIELDLGYNELKMIPDEIGKLVNLQTLILYGKGNCKEISNSIYKLKSLQRLWLPDSLEYLSPDVSNLGSLTFLALPWELIVSNKDLILSLKRLKKIYPYNVYENREEHDKLHKKRIESLILMFPNIDIDTSCEIN